MGRGLGLLHGPSLGLPDSTAGSGLGLLMALLAQACSLSPTPQVAGSNQSPGGPSCRWCVTLELA
eukprot:363597-Chlamydomonas_euryale.AAC.4